MATLWWPRLDPVGPASLFAVTAAVILWILADVPAFSRFRKLVLISSVVLFACFLFVSAANLVAFGPLHVPMKHRRFPDLDDYLANYLFLAVGMVFGVKLARLPGLSRLVGITAVVFFAGLPLVELCGLIYWRPEI